MQVAHGIIRQNFKERRKVEEKVERKAEVKKTDEDAQQKEETAEVAVAPRKRTRPKIPLVHSQADAVRRLQANQIDHYAGNGPKPGKTKGLGNVPRRIAIIGTHPHVSSTR